MHDSEIKLTVNRIIVIIYGERITVTESFLNFLAAIEISVDCFQLAVVGPSRSDKVLVICIQHPKGLRLD